MDRSQLAALMQYLGLPAAGAGAAGAAGAAGLSAASALNPVSAGIMAAAPLASGIYGIVQKAQANKLRKQFDQPMYAIPQGMQEAYGLAQSRAFDTSLPGQSLIEAGIDRGQASANRAIMESGLSGAERLAAINAGAGNRMDANTQLAMQMAQQQQQNLANYQNTLGQLAGYQEKQWQLNKQQPWMDAMEAANRLSEAGSQNIMTGLKDLSGIGVAMAKQRTPQIQSPQSETNKGTIQLLNPENIGGSPNVQLEGSQGVIPQGTLYSDATNWNPLEGLSLNKSAAPNEVVATAGNTSEVIPTPPAVNTAQNIVTTQPTTTTTATEAVTPVASTLPVQEAMNFNAAPSMMAAQPIVGIDQSAMPQSPAQQFLTPVTPPAVQQSTLPVGPPSFQSFMQNGPITMPAVEITDTAPASTPLGGNMASPFNLQPNYSVQDQYGFMLPTPPSLTENQIQQIVNPTNKGMTQDRFVSPMSFGISGVGTNSGTKQMSSMPTMTQFQSASPREKLDLFAQGFGQFGLKGK